MASTLTKRDVDDLAEADAAYWRTKAAHDAAKTRRKELLAKYQAKLPAGEWVKAHGRVLRRSSRSSGARFSLKAFLEAGYKVTKPMRRFVSDGEPYDILEIRSSG